MTKTPMPPLLLEGDCLAQMRRMPDDSIDAIVTDPPYGLSDASPAQIADVLRHWTNGGREAAPTGRGFMGKSWDAFVPPPAVWDEALRVLKPGGHLLAFAGSRTFDLMGLSIRLAGFELRDSIAWLYGSGFPKSLDVSKAIDSAAGATREVVGRAKGAAQNAERTAAMSGGLASEYDTTLPATAAARHWHGWGTALKPAFEPIVVARKPLAGTVAANVLAHGTGALNIDASRIGETVETWPKTRSYGQGSPVAFTSTSGDVQRAQATGDAPAGRWPANVMLDESQAAALDAQSGTLKSGANPTRRGADGDRTAYGDFAGQADAKPQRGVDVGGASRFFYVAKAPKSERPNVDGVAHPTVKPLALMRYLVKLVTPPGGVVLDPFAGSGATLEAAYLEGFEAIGCELTPDYWPLVEHRIERVAGALAPSNAARRAARS